MLHVHDFAMSGYVFVFFGCSVMFVFMLFLGIYCKRDSDLSELT